MATATHSKKKKTSKRKSPAQGGYEMPVSIGLFALGALLIVMLFVEGQSIWAAVRTALFGFFGLNMYFLGVLLLYFAVAVARGESIWVRVAKAVLCMLCLSGTAVIFSRLDVSGLEGLALLDAYRRTGTESLLGGGLLGIVAGGTLLALCGRPAANIIVIVLCLCAAMAAAGITPAELWEFLELHVGSMAGSVKDHSGAALEDYRERRAERREELEALKARQEQQEAERAARQPAPEPPTHKMNWFSFLRRDPAAGLEQEGEAAPAQPEAQPQPEPPQPRASFDIDLGPDPVELREGESEPIEPITIGPGGTFGLDALRRREAEPAAAVQAGAAPTEPELDEFFMPIATQAAEPELILPDGAAAPVAGQAAAPGGPAAAPADPFAAGEEGWISIDSGAPTPEGDLDKLAAAAMTKPQTAEQAAAQSLAAPAPAAPAQNVYHYPPLELFEKPQEGAEVGAEAELKANAQKLVDTLDSFGVKTRVLDISRGPSVTRYELQPLAGVKISRITSLSDDIALNLAVAGVRIEAPIPGKPAVGIEVPNRKSSSVSIRGIFESQNYQRMASPLTIALGKDIAGVAQVADLCKMPHLLIAGSTGSGKSVCVNSIIISFLYRSSPEDVKLILIDPKVVELAEYNGIPHLLMPVVTEPRKAAGALGSAVAEMEKRYRLFADHNVRDIKTYNKAAQEQGLEKLPYIAIVIDELADLMMVAGKEVEDYICRIAQKARAAGMHLIVATQRPSVDVITGLIKANIPSRIAFAVSSQVDSRTILDGAGAEKLLGMGDMLFMPVGASKPVRIQGTYVRDEEITRVLDFIKAGSSAVYDEAMIAEMDKLAAQEKGGGKDSGGEDDAGEMDPMLKQAADVVIDAGQASTSLLQRRCKLGYARAARIMDEMERMGIIGPYEGAKPRAVLVSRQQWIEMNQNGSADRLPEQMEF